MTEAAGFAPSRLGHGMISRIKWKGPTVSQLAPVLKRNGDSGTDPDLAFRARPIKGYRLEIASSVGSVGGGAATASRVRDFEIPGGTVVNSRSARGGVGTCGTLDFTLPGNSSERYCTNSENSTNVINSDAANARRRVRSAGMMPRKFLDRGDTGDPIFKSSYAQYNYSRVLTFRQNQFNYLKEGTRSAVPGDNLSLNNVYASNSMNPCPKLFIGAAVGNNTFTYVWVNAAAYSVTLSDGYYDVDDLRTALRSAMYANKTYYTDSITGSPVYLLDWYFDSYDRCMVIQCVATSTTIHSSVLGYGVPSGASWTIPSTTVVPQFSLGTAFARVLGAPSGAGFYPSVGVATQLVAAAYSGNTTFNGYGALAGPSFKPIYYKPNNPGYAQQGAVSASDRVARIKYEAVTDAASTFRSAYGAAAAAANAYAYSINEGRYGDKWKNFALTSTPKVDAVTGAVKCCDKFIYRAA